MKKLTSGNNPRAYQYPNAHYPGKQQLAHQNVVPADKGLGRQNVHEAGLPT